MHRGTTRLIAAVCVASLAMIGDGAAADSGGRVGFDGGSFAGIGTSNSATVTKPESKLWWNDGRWWASMWDPGRGGNWIFRLDAAEQRWENTGVALDARARSRADVLWDGRRLYVASHIHSSTYASGYPALLYRFSYDPAAKRYAADTGFPAQISDVRTEELVIDKDSTGTIWATWVYGGQVYVNRTLGADAAWGTPFVLPVAGTTVDTDDIAALIAFGGDKVGVMWSNQLEGTVYFGVHRDGAPASAWELEVVAQGAGEADDHINLKADAAGRVFAVVKTNRSGSSSPLIKLHVRSPEGAWADHVVAIKAEAHTRPILLLDEANQKVRVFATAEGKIYVKTAATEAIAFEPGRGSVFIADPDTPTLNDATSTKQNPTPESGLVVLASNTTTFRYWHNVEEIGRAAAPSAAFTAEAVAGPAPFTASFTDTSTGGPTSWAWDFGDGGSATERNPKHTYERAGTYTVTLTVSNSAGSDARTVRDYITVTEPPSARTVLAAADAEVRASKPGSNYGGGSRLSVKKDAYRSYLKFVVPDAGGRSVTNAKLRLFVTAASKDGGNVYAVSNEWTESTITWNNAPPLGVTRVRSVGPATVGTWVEIDLGDAISGPGIYSFAVADGSTNSAYYSSREGGNAPELVISTE